MPVEGQWERVNTPLPARDKRVLAVAACVLVLGAAGAVVASLIHPAKSNAGCVVVTVASTTGGAVLRNCGLDAKTFCDSQSNLGNALDQCARLGYLTRAVRSSR